MGRESKGELKEVKLRLTGEVHATLQSAAREMGIPLATFCSYLCGQWVFNQRERARMQQQVADAHSGPAHLVPVNNEDGGAIPSHTLVPERKPVEGVLSRAKSEVRASLDGIASEG